MRERVTKKQLAVEMHERGMNVSAIAELLRTEPSYVANALIERGYVPNYMDLYTSTGPQNEHAALLAGVLRFRDLEAARTSVSKIEALFNEFVSRRDRRGMHQCQVLALVGKNRAEGIGKLAEARLFTDWLQRSLKAVSAVPAEPDAAPSRRSKPTPRAA
ncbi:MAG: hypothetical protein U1A78_06755 [Polyangia bacterium]